MDTETLETPQLGAPYEGGFFGGILLINGIRHGIAWAPKQFQFRSKILDCSRSHVIEAAGSPCDSVANTSALLELGSPAAKKVAALTINGHADWALPAKDALELGYRYFKPSSCKNYCGFRDGENPSSLPQGLWYTPDMPAQTALEAFKKGGAEEFDANWYVSSTVTMKGYAFCQYFDSGNQGNDNLDLSHLVRAVRQIRLDP